MEIDIVLLLALEIMGERNIQKHSTLPFWKISKEEGSGFDYEEKKCNLLRFILNGFPLIYLEYDENPQGWSIKGDWVQANERTWLIPQERDVNEIYEWLKLGNWFLYASKNVLSGEIDFSLLEPEKLLILMEQEDISFVLTAFHDNDPWFIGVSSVNRD